MSSLGSRRAWPYIRHGIDDRRINSRDVIATSRGRGTESRYLSPSPLSNMLHIGIFFDTFCSGESHFTNFRISFLSGPRVSVSARSVGSRAPLAAGRWVPASDPSMRLSRRLCWHGNNFLHPHRVPVFSVPTSPNEISEAGKSTTEDPILDFDPTFAIVLARQECSAWSKSGSKMVDPRWQPEYQFSTRNSKTVENFEMFERALPMCDGYAQLDCIWFQDGGTKITAGISVFGP